LHVDAAKPKPNEKEGKQATKDSEKTKKVVDEQSSKAEAVANGSTAAKDTKKPNK
jgi:hypothetical protein